MDDVPATVDVEPLTPNAERLLERGEHALLGVSPGNSYFTVPRLTALLGWARSSFDAVDVMYVDLHLDSMYVCSGTTPQKAGARATRAVRDTRRRIRRAVEATGGTASELRVDPLSRYVERPGYRAVLGHVDEVVRTNDRLRRSCEEHVESVIAERADGDAPEAREAMLRAGLAYLRTEMPFLVNTPEVLDVPTSLNCYHSVMPVLRGIQANPALCYETQGHVIVRPSAGTA
ncbi:tRNA-dependent cyclodipeptide synthase [Actinomadura fibrosa]|uniref:Cyclodipeptide synthase n=1 Tax=Actinomadura fibrosa TaxID=111802 RepID=A0ABW2XX18_9ACTN|nr:tRNA-dependent cyclodipeptide synthase [Actinomadura fibrosa]